VSAPGLLAKFLQKNKKRNIPPPNRALPADRCGSPPPQPPPAGHRQISSCQPEIRERDRHRRGSRCRGRGSLVHAPVLPYLSPSLPKPSEPMLPAAAAAGSGCHVPHCLWSGLRSHTATTAPPAAGTRREETDAPEERRSRSPCRMKMRPLHR
jgi:hypothetical protein